MCGIAGAAWSQEAAPLSSATLERMTSAIRHRGPDDAGTYFSTAVGDPLRGSTFPAQTINQKTAM